MRSGLMLAAAVLGGGAAVRAQEPLESRVRGVLAQAGPGTRFGVVVLDEDGRELIALAPDDRFIPASNTKMFTTAAAMATLATDVPDADGGASVRIDPRGGGAPDVVLVGHGDARLSSAADCRTDCLGVLADAVAASFRTVHDVVGDDSAFPDERWSLGMSWNNIATRSGTAISALTLDDNELPLVVTPGAVPGAPATVAGQAYHALDIRVRSVATGVTAIGYDRMPGSDLVRVDGTIAVGAAPEQLHLGIDDPARYAAWRLRDLLRRRGVRVTGTVAVRHRPRTSADDPALRGTVPPARAPEPAALARLVPAPLADDVLGTNKVSQNLHAELLLRRVGAATGSGSVADGLAAVGAMLASAGLPRVAYDFSDGSGMSTYNRISPRGAVRFLRWAGTQPWGATWRATLPVAGVDGTLARRFVGTPLQGRLFAKTGSLNATSALAGYLTAASGRTLTFAIYANDVPAAVAATRTMDSALLLIAAAN